MPIWHPLLDGVSFFSEKAAQQTTYVVDSQFSVAILIQQAAQYVVARLSAQKASQQIIQSVAVTYVIAPALLSQIPHHNGCEHSQYLGHRT